MNTPTPFRVTSADGTEIAVWRSGDGPVVLLVHGTAGDHFSFRFVEPLLAEHCSVHVIDRRGRGKSGDGPDYAIEREYEDLAAVLGRIGEPVTLVGHSFGADVALGTSLLVPDLLDRLVLYEPGIGAEEAPPGVIARLESLIDTGEREEALLLMLREVAGMSSEEVEVFRSSPMWPVRVVAAHTTPRELRAEVATVFEPAVFADMRVPALALLGTESPAWAQETTLEIVAGLPDARVQPLEGHGHAAIMTAPELVTEAILKFM